MEDIEIEGKDADKDKKEFKAEKEDKENNYVAAHYRFNRRKMIYI